jgi:Fe2+ or Zn2+ uptake regulation protein
MLNGDELDLDNKDTIYGDNFSYRCEECESVLDIEYDDIVALYKQLAKEYTEELNKTK